MLIVEDLHGHFSDPIEKHYDLGRFSSDDGKVFFHGIGTIENPYYKEKYQSYEKRAFWNLEHPCAWYGSNIEYMRKSANTDDYFNKVMTICPYTAPWLNEVQDRETFVFSNFPFNKNLVTHDKEEKVHDVIYWGGIHHKDHMDFVDSMTQFDYNFLSLGAPYWAKEFMHSGYDKYITGHHVARAKMWELLRKTKICLISNQLYLQPHQVAQVKSVAGWEKCEAFSHIDDAVLPQIKTRMIESAANRCLMLVKRNPWEVETHSFEVGKEFIYFDKNEDLPGLIEEISANWNQHEEMVENAFIKATTVHTVENFIDQTKEELDD